MVQPTLFIVATPIGTLADFSARAQDVLRSVDTILCEDTRESAKLLHHFSIEKPLLALHLHNEKASSDHLLERILSTPHKTAALISDAGTPAISDPGALFVRSARNRGFKVLSVPGPSSLTAALAASGFLQPRSLFCGFLPREKKERIQEFKRWQSIAPAVCVAFESPKRVEGALSAIADSFGPEVEVCLAREISKKFEEHICGNVSEVRAKIADGEVRGECVLCINVTEQWHQAPAKALTLEELLKTIVSRVKEGAVLKEVTKELALGTQHSAKELYNAALRQLRDPTHE